MPTVLIAEDDLMMADMLEEILVEAGYAFAALPAPSIELLRSANVTSLNSPYWICGWQTAVLAQKWLPN